MRISEEIAAFASVFRENGYQLYLVGGAVRDYLLGKENHDADFTTDAEPGEVKSLFRRTIDTGIKHGTVTVRFRGRQITHQEIGLKVMQDFVSRVKDVAVVERKPLVEGRHMIMILAPKAPSKEAKQAPKE